MATTRPTTGNTESSPVLAPDAKFNQSDWARLPVRENSELKNLTAAELKAAIRSSWKKYERPAKEEMGPLLFWLRLKLRAQGSRNDIRDKDRGFGAWVEENLSISRRTADRWADDYGTATGLPKRDGTSSQSSKSDKDGFYKEELKKRGLQIGFSYSVSQTVHKRYQEALKLVKKHFGIENDNEAVLRAVLYAAESISGRRIDSSTSSRSVPR